MQPRYRSLVMGPQVLTLQLVWDQQVTGDDIRGTLSQVEEVLDITRIYNEMDVSRELAPRSPVAALLRGVCCVNTTAALILCWLHESTAWSRC